MPEIIPVNGYKYDSLPTYKLLNMGIEFGNKDKSKGLTYRWDLKYLLVTALMFPAIPLIMGVYSNRFHSLSAF